MNYARNFQKLRISNQIAEPLTYIQEFLIKLDLLGFTLLNAVNLSSIHKQLAKAMATHIDH